ncbi:MAG: 3'-5' exonuclease, partial [Bacteroidales bacterium]
PIEIYDLVEAVLRIWTIDANVDQYVITFLDAVHLEGGKNIKEVLDWWEKKSEKYAVSTAAPKDAVKVMSIHKAKGLEFQTVIYPYANDKISIYRDLNWIEGEDLKEEIGLPSALVQYTKEMAFTKFSSKMKEEKNKTLVDYLNLLYVATTRACKHLHVLCDESSGNISMDAFSYSDAFNAFVTAYPEYLDKQSLSVNSKENIETKIENLKEVEVDPLQEKQLGIALPSFDWRKRLVPAIEKENIEGAEILWGKFIHEALSCLDGKNDVERAIEKALGKYSRFFLRKEEAKKRIYCVVNDARLKPFFYGDYLVKSETSIYAFSKQFRPDRVMVKGKEAVILDYKTGKELENHLLQMRSYVAALKAMGYEKVQSFLVYIETENLKIKEVD